MPIHEKISHFVANIVPMYYVSTSFHCDIVPTIEWKPSTLEPPLSLRPWGNFLLYPTPCMKETMSR